MGESTRFSSALDDSKAVALTGKIMVVAIIVLFVVVVFVIFLHLYTKWFWRRLGEEEEGTDWAPSRSRRIHRRRRRRLVFAPGQDPTAALHRGLDSSVLRSLPALVFRAEDFRDRLECAVCLSELADGERARLLPKCNHGFHVDCIDMWFQSHSTCPLCRNSVAPEKDSSPESVGVDDPQIGVDSSAAEESEIDIPIFPTNVLIWGDQSQVSSGNACLEDEGGSTNVLPSPSSSSNDGVLVIDVPRGNPVASSSASGEELKSPVTTRLRSLKRLLSREKKVNPCSSNSVSDIEQGNRAQS